MPPPGLAPSFAAAEIDLPGLGRLLFSPEGRLRRRDYWLAHTAVLTLAIVLAIGFCLLAPTIVASIACAPIVLVYWWARCCLRAKRWHDLGKSAAWDMIGLVPLVGWAWVFAECALRPGTPGANAYGASPK